MEAKQQVQLRRRALLSGVAAVAALAIARPLAAAVFDRIVMRDGWLLRESDLA